MAYVKDIKRGQGFVRFGQGELASNGYFKLLKQIGYRAPVCLHIEFDWSDKGKTKTRAALAQALQESGQVLRRWLATGSKGVLDCAEGVSSGPKREKY